MAQLAFAAVLSVTTPGTAKNTLRFSPPLILEFENMTEIQF
jgi:4-aminobutyrate aminotransferase-like enzyme